jgi:BCD family chlorophyll transporter-like MFS transporter
VRHLAALALGTMAFSMQDILLEPYGGEILGLSVGGTTLLTATLAAGTLVGFILASRLLGRGTDPFRLAHRGALLGLPAFACVLAAAPLQSSALFVLGAFLVGWGAGLFGHATLTASMSLAPAEQRGLALGTWGAVQATAAGVAIAAGGVLRDGVGTLAAMGSLGPALTGPETGYGFVYGLEMLLLIIACTVLAPLARSRT